MEGFQETDRHNVGMQGMGTRTVGTQGVGMRRGVDM